MRIIQKYGGTSVADIARLEHVALRVKKTVAAGNQVAVVVSAMAGVTNQLVNYTKDLAGTTLSPEYDAVVATGEQITTGLLALALQQIGVPARSFMGWQLPIRTNNHPTNAEILSINPEPLEECWAAGIVPVIAGFQGIDSKKRITTLGRGGSDTTAVAVAAAVRADRCDIYTDVDGIYTADPRIVPDARKLLNINYIEMLELAAHGAKVLHQRSVETALNFDVPLRVLSSFNDAPGTDIVSNNFLPSLPRICGITHSPNWMIINQPLQGAVRRQVRSLRKLIRNTLLTTDMLVIEDDGKSVNAKFIIPQAELSKCLEAFEKSPELARLPEMVIRTDLAKVSIIGANLTQVNGFSDQLLQIAKTYGDMVDILGITASKFILAVPLKSIEDIVRHIHSEYILNQEQYIESQKSLAARL